MGMFTGHDLDFVLIASVAAIGVTAIIVIYLGFKLRTLMNTTHSED
jgi:hypothetical protein